MNVKFLSFSHFDSFLGDNKSPLRADIRMIDFAHVHAITDGGIDEGYLKGLTNLLAFFKRYELNNLLLIFSKLI